MCEYERIWIQAYTYLQTARFLWICRVHEASRNFNSSATRRDKICNYSSRVYYRALSIKMIHLRQTRCLNCHCTTVIKTTVLNYEILFVYLRSFADRWQCRLSFWVTWHCVLKMRLIMNFILIVIAGNCVPWLIN